MLISTPNVSSDCVIVSSRIVAAPQEVVYRAWTEPDHLKKWWGPAGFTNTFQEFDLRPGGKWTFIMHGPDKGNYLNECVFIEIGKPRLIAWNHLSEPQFQMLATFDALRAEKTQVTFKMIFEDMAACNKIKGFAVAKNEENLDRLEEELHRMMS
jgi:uncharacterized protein YndB with AHSA1/START domain